MVSNQGTPAKPQALKCSGAITKRLAQPPPTTTHVRPPVPLSSLSWAEQSQYPNPSKAEEFQGNTVVADLQGELSMLDVLLPLEEEIEDTTMSHRSDVSGVQNFESHSTDVEDAASDVPVTEGYRSGVPAYTLERLTEPLPFEVPSRYLILPDELRPAVTYVALVTMDAPDQYVKVDESILDLNGTFKVTAYYSKEAGPTLAYIFEE